jgi:uncharacterized protein YyaL (SSP411 family)
MESRESRLAKETSPYLRQHAGNAVDWWPWCTEALAKARTEDTPIFLSIGYSACHWCHVMERESFSNAAIASALNEHFVSVLVDREERPDVDQIHQLAAQILGQSGGWPLTVFLTPDARPFFVGTYFPPEDRLGMLGMPRLLETIREAFTGRRDEVELQGQELTRALERAQKLADTPEPRSKPGEPFSAAAKALLERVDTTHGGFGDRPKFLNVTVLEALLRCGVRTGDQRCLESVRRALDRMREGGIWDQLEGGFHRYSTDERWRVPHFEKMLSDNALILRLYARSARIFGDERYAETARSIVAYALARMRDASGLFYTSEDADSEGAEGSFYLWSEADFTKVLGEDPLAFDVARMHFGVTKPGNFERPGLTVLAVARPLDQVAIALNQRPTDVQAALDRARARLLAARDERPRPFCDKKCLTGWNALFVSALAEAGGWLDETSWIEAAERTFSAIEENLVAGDDVQRYLEGRTVSRAAGRLDDYAYLGNAALDLHQTTANPRYVGVARALADAMIDRFRDPAEGFLFTPLDTSDLVVLPRNAFDQAVPAATSAAMLVCLRLGELVDDEYAEEARAESALLRSHAAADPFALASAVDVIDRMDRGSTTIVVVGPSDAPETVALKSAAYESFDLDRVIVLIDPSREDMIAAAPLLSEGKPHGGVAAYLCRGRSCSQPIRSAEELRAELRNFGATNGRGRDPELG